MYAIPAEYIVGIAQSELGFIIINNKNHSKLVISSHVMNTNSINLKPTKQIFQISH